MKKIFRSICLSLAAVVALTVLAACNVTKSTDAKYFVFTLNEAGDGYVASASAEQMPKTVIIPAEHEGKPVVSVADNGFNGANCFAITDVVIKAEGDFTIGDSAFKGLKNLRSLEIRSKGDVTIGHSSFEGCPDLKTVELAEDIHYINVVGFAFKDSGLTSFKVHAKEAVDIGEYAFAGAKALAEIELGNTQTFSVTAINECSALGKIVVSGAVSSDENGNLFSADNSELIRFLHKGQTEYEVTCTKVCEGAFSGSDVKIVTLSSSVASVEGYAFADSVVEKIICNGDISGFDQNWYRGTNAQIVVPQ